MPVVLVLAALGAAGGCGATRQTTTPSEQPGSPAGVPASSTRPAVRNARAPAGSPQSAGTGQFRPQFGDSGLVTNEYAYRHPEDPARRVSPNWIMTSGSLFASHGTGWTGVPDRRTPNAQSSSGTDSAVFRLVSRRRTFANVRVSLQLFAQRHSVVPGSEHQNYDGVHIWLRYASQTKVYTFSVMRWDGQAVIKRKTPGGPSNGGTYRTLASAPSVLAVGRWVPITVEAINRKAGVQLTISIHGKLVLRSVDLSGLALTQPGAIGIRGDNTQFKFRHLQAMPIPQ